MGFGGATRARSIPETEAPAQKGTFRKYAPVDRFPNGKSEKSGDWTAPDREFPSKLGEDVRIIRQQPDGRHALVCASCEKPLDLAAGEWVPLFPERQIHGYRVSQLHSSKVDPGEILEEYRTTRYPDRFYNLKIGIPWTDLERRLDTASVLERCTDLEMLSESDSPCSMGVDTGKSLHVVILQEQVGGEQFRLVHLQECREFEDLDELIRRFSVDRLVIDGLPETHATRKFVERHRSVAFMSFFKASQRGQADWDDRAQTVNINRTDALDASRSAIRDGLVELPRRLPIVEEFAEHVAANAKVLDRGPGDRCETVPLHPYGTGTTTPLR